MRDRSEPRLSHEVRALFSLSGPLIVALVGHQAITLVDTFAAGRIGVEALAAVSLGGAIYWAVTVFPLGVLLGLDPLVSQALGAGDESAAWADVRRGVGLAAAMSVGAMTLIYLLGTPGLPWAPAGSPVTAELRAYLVGRLWCVPM
ncbi:MAG: MATE family efflux transporter, partial [Deltaproteobacteria bacterium]|nr:MATE family efflux transporter [Deltaproteobacteria bacterium]